MAKKEKYVALKLQQFSLCYVGHVLSESFSPSVEDYKVDEEEIDW